MSTDTITIDTRQRSYEQVVPGLQWNDGVLEQCWKVTWRDYNTNGAFETHTYEWRPVPALTSRK